MGAEYGVQDRSTARLIKQLKAEYERQLTDQLQAVRSVGKAEAMRAKVRHPEPPAQLRATAAAGVRHI